MFTTIDIHSRNISSLTNSLVIKFIDVALAVNIGLQKKYNLPISEDMRTWKYFLNMAGFSHITNNDVKIRLIENNELVSLNKNILDTYKYTRIELSKFDDYFNDLVAKYPDDYSFIKGCIFPVDIDKAIASEEGSILNYNHNLVENNEYSLIRELELYVKNFHKRYNIGNYMLTDNLYMPSFLAVLYADIPNKINNIRISKINTNEVHSFHMEHFFRSHLDLWDNIQILNNETKFWLYKNLRYLMKHTGKESTLKTILNNIFEKNNIGIGEYVLEKNEPTISENPNDLLKPSFTDNGSKFVANKLNNSYVMDNNTVISPETIINLELTTINDLDLPLSSLEQEDIVLKEVNKISNSIIHKQKTKILDINTFKLFKTHGVDLILALMDNWLYLASTGRYNRKTVYIDPNTKVNYELSPIEGYYILMKLILTMNNNSNIKLSFLYWTHIINATNIDVDNITHSLFNNEDAIEVAKIIKSVIPNDLYSINNSEEFSNYMSARIKIYELLWVLDSNAQNPVMSSNIKTLISRIYENGEVDLRISGELVTIDDLLKTTTIEFYIPENYNMPLAIKELFLTFTGINIEVFEDLYNSIVNYTDILNKLTSYTLQVIKSVDDVESVYSPYTEHAIFNSKKGLITITDASIAHVLEPDLTIITGNGNNFKDKLDGLTALNGGIIEEANILSTMLEIPEEKEIELIQLDPVFMVEVLREIVPYAYPDITVASDTRLNNMSFVNNTLGRDSLIESAFTDLNKTQAFDTHRSDNSFVILDDRPVLLVEIEENNE